jgi:hypothetical protein
MHHVPQAGLTVPAVAGPVERVVRRHLGAVSLVGLILGLRQFGDISFDDRFCDFVVFGVEHL